MAATVVDDTGVDSYAQQTSLGCFRVHNDCKYKNEIKMKLLSTSAISNLEAKARCTFGAFFKSYMLNSSLQPTNKVGRGYLDFSRVSTLYRGGGGRENCLIFLKCCTVLWGHLETTKNYEYCITVPRALVWDCRYDESINKGNRTIVQFDLKSYVWFQNWRSAHPSFFHVNNMHQNY